MLLEGSGQKVDGSSRNGCEPHLYYT